MYYVISRSILLKLFLCFFAIPQQLEVNPEMTFKGDLTSFYRIFPLFMGHMFPL